MLVLLVHYLNVFLVRRHDAGCHGECSIVLKTSNLQHR